jgi:hypothetical protein
MLTHLPAINICPLGMVVFRWSGLPCQKGLRVSATVCLPNLSNGIFVAFIPSGRLN